MSAVARALAPEEREQLEAALAELTSDGQSVTLATPAAYTDADVDALVAYLRATPIFAVGDCGARLCAAFGAGAADAPRATAARLLAAMRGDTAMCERYATYLALTRALKGLDHVVASFERGACAAFWPAAGGLFRPPTMRYSTAGKVPVIVFAPVGLDPEAVLRVPPQQLYACLHYQTETFLAAEASRRQRGHVLIFDLLHFSRRHLHRRFLTQVVNLVAMMLKNYPELIDKLHIVNAPALFSVAWAAILPFANESVQAKIAISRGSALDELRALVGEEGLPADLGGQVHYPAADQAEPQAEEEAEAEAEAEGAWAELEVEAGKTASAVVHVTDEDLAAADKAAAAVAGADDSGAEKGACSLALDFTIGGADIAFFAVREPLHPAAGKGGGKAHAAAEQEYAIEPSTLLTQDAPISRLVEASAPATFTFVWDNGAAWRYPRTIRYRLSKVYGPSLPHGGATALAPTSGLPEWEGLADADVAKLVATAP